MSDYADIDKVLSELRHGHSCLLLNDNSAGGMTGFVVAAAEHCQADHIAFMARQARGLVCLALTPQRCAELALPLMVEGDDSLSPFTLSIEAATGIDTGISAADRARTVQVAVDTFSQPSDLVQPGHIFPIAAAAGGVLTRTAPAEAAVDLAMLAGLLPAAIFTEVLDAVDRVTNQTITRRLEPRRAGDPAELVSDPSRIRETLPWQPRHADLEQIIAHALQWERKLSDLRGE